MPTIPKKFGVKPFRYEKKQTCKPVIKLLDKQKVATLHEVFPN